MWRLGHTDYVETEMAKAAKKGSTKQTRLARQGSAGKTIAREMRPPSRKSRGRSEKSEGWLSAATTLVSSPAGRAILAEVLVAVAEVLRKSASIEEAPLLRGKNGFRTAL